ncbi:multicopper oxidase domain-containing protein [uncultured Thiohalocapsa sp.]|uniref:multicopper oxidase domain-containing protein n=1 Tax=uncultured Thiohalocapsa sp. TaxID=768990 RepID=UPI0025FFBEF8|nr:multicopper oxidase domain-containing protein [uncultured Thiohalocapsa sp.]
MNSDFKKRALPAGVLAVLLGGSGAASAVVNVQCPGDLNGDADWDDVVDGVAEVRPADNIKCMHLIAGDSFAVMSDGNPLYTFGFKDITGTPPEEAIADGILASEWPGSLIELDEGDEFYLSLTNVGTVIRPDLFDPHTVHWHGFPNAATVFDGVPEVSIAINMGATLTYYYKVMEPGDYMYHCHVEATEHMEMGMLANLYVHPRQDATGCTGSIPCPVATRKGGTDPAAPTGYVYNDDDGTTAWDVEKAIQISSFDSRFHDASLFVQPLPFALLDADYPMLNGRGYPDTVVEGALPAPVDSEDGKVTGTAGTELTNGKPTQVEDAVVELAQGERLLLRLNNVSVDRFYTLTAQGLTMQVVGTGARHARGVDGKNIYRETASVNFGGGETKDILIDTDGVAPGTYFLYATELHQLSNRTELDGGMITEIVIN